VRKLLAGAALAGLVMGTVTSLAPTANAAPEPLKESATVRGAVRAVPGSAPAPALAWAKCEGRLGQRGVECATLQVPLDHARPAGPKIKLALSRVKHTVADAKYQGVMLVNPGGPGGSGLGLALLGGAIPANAGDAYDWIGFDPRGVGSSTPALTCDPNYNQGPRPQYVPTNPSIEKAWLDRARGYAKKCGKNGGSLLEHVKTVDVVKDMDLIRVALGQKQINYFGFSYGTYLGQVYSTLYPKNVRRMVFDGTVDPRKVWYQANLDQDIAFEKTMRIWFGWLAKYDSTYHLGNTARKVQLRFYTEQGKLDKSPAGGVVGGSEWTDILLSAGYYQSTWTELADVFSKWANDGDTATLVAAYEGAESVGDDNGYAVYAAVQCTDVRWPLSWKKWKRDNSRVFRKAPFETWANAWFNAPCLTWPAKPGKPVTVDGSKVKNVLMINETLDAATPYPGSLEVRKRYPGARLIAEPGGTTHSGSLAGNACVDDKIAAYLATGALPKRLPGRAADVVCAPLPQPVPGAASLTRGAPVAPDLATQARRDALRH
jgi:pimeloyl-ACP methyl ester carboxylesterase